MQYVQEHSNGIPSEHAHQPIIRTQSNAGRIATGLQDARLKQASRGREIHLYSGPARAASPSSSPLMYCAAASNPGLPSCSSSKSVSSHHTSKKHSQGRRRHTWRPGMSTERRRRCWSTRPSEKASRGASAFSGATWRMWMNR
jgi:hypothetical protein